MGKIFFRPPERCGDTVHLTGNPAHHLLHVLRMRTGQELTLCDGQGTDFSARLETITAKPSTATFTLLSQYPSGTEPTIPITLYQGLPKGDKMDWIIEKCIEAGVNKIVPVCTARTVVKIKDTAKKAERYARISESAASQSMRGIIPEIAPPKSFADAVAEAATAPCLVAYENERTRLIKSTISSLPPGPISLWVGPEGGFEESEIGALEEKGAIPISLGPRILRTETAGLVALAQILCLWEAPNDLF